MSSPSPSPGELIRWSEALAGLARTGLAFTASVFERERFEEVLAVASDIAVAADVAIAGTGPPSTTSAGYLAEWLRELPRGIEGYRTPRVSVGAIVGNAAGELLLVKRQDSGLWLYPTGWADIGYSAAEIAVKEVAEETGIVVTPRRLAMVLDGLRIGLSRIPLYSLVFHCEAIGGSLLPHPLECVEVGWFGPEQLPEPLVGAGYWAEHAFAVIRGETEEVHFERPRTPQWRRPQPERPSRR